MTLIKIFISPQAVAKSSLAGWPTTFEPQREDPLRMEGTIVGDIVICIIDTLQVGTLLSAVISPVHKTIGELVPQL